MTARAKALTTLGLVAAIAAGVFVYRKNSVTSAASSRTPSEADVATGGTLNAALRADPRSFNPLTATDASSALVGRLLHASLVRVNRTTDQVEPWLAERIDSSPDGITHTFTLRRGATFSNGTPVTSADVVFTLDAIYDEQVGSPLADGLLVGGQRMTVSAPDASTVVLTLPRAGGSMLRALDPVPVLPRHALEAAWKAGTLAASWKTTTPPSELTGSGPFIVESYQPGERLVLARNPRYWRRDTAGKPLPYVDRLTLDIVPDQNTELLRFDSRSLDLLVATVRPEDHAAFRRLAAEGTARLHDMGVALDADFLWFNLSSAALKRPDRPWLHETALRQAISHAVDRAAIADTVFLGTGIPVHGPVTPGNKVWYSPDIRTYEYDVAKARALLSTLGLEDRNGDGVAEDAGGQPARFSILTQKGTSIRERTVSVVQQHLKAVGLAVDVVPLDVGSLIDRLNTGDFEAIYFGVNTSDTDPSASVEFWLSSGSFNPWNAADKTPASDWERTIDDLMRRQMTSNDLEERRRLFAQVQRVFSEHLPAIYFIAPRVTVATSSRVLNAEPSLLRPYVLWAADTLALRK